MKSKAFIELKNLKLLTQIGTYGSEDQSPQSHLLDLSLQIDETLVLISSDEMKQVFDYDPLIKEIERLAGERHYQTQEYLMTRIARACATHPEIVSMEMCLTKTPVLNETGTLGVRMVVNETSFNALRASNFHPSN
jgi:FolB domain-containing protein